MSNSAFSQFLVSIKPKYKFGNKNFPKEPSYEEKLNWLSLPEVDGPQYLLPSNDYKINKNNEVDLFYIHPTGFYGQEWNASIDKNKSSFERAQIALANQATVFNETCNIYAPNYRQATYYSFFAKTDDGILANELAYSDIKRAFEYFINNFNSNKPFVIAAHSQGSLHAMRLVSELIDKTDLYKRLICAYIIGYIIPTKEYKKLYTNIKPSEKYNDINCISSWLTVVENYKKDRERTMFWTPNGWKIEYMNQKLISTNPLSWKNDNQWIQSTKDNLSIINKAKNYDFHDRYREHNTRIKKTITKTAFQSFSTKRNQETGLIECKGELIEKIKTMKNFTGDLHAFDVMLFWGSIRKNIKDRIKKYFNNVR